MSSVQPGHANTQDIHGGDATTSYESFQGMNGWEQEGWLPELTRLSQLRWTQFALTPLQMPSVSCSHHRSFNYFLNCSAQPIIHKPGLPAATREGWSLHMCYIREMLPWVFASDKTNYARYLTVYWCEMMLLPWTYLHANAVLESG